MQLPLLLRCLLSGAAPWWQTETSGVASFPLMSKRTTSMLITTKRAKFWLIIRALCGGSDELRLSAFLKTVHQNSWKLWVGAGFRRARPYGWHYCNSAQFMTSTSDKRNETHPHGGRCPLTKTTEQNIGGCVWLMYYCLSSLFMCSLSLSSLCGGAENSFVLDPRSRCCTVSQKVERRRVRNSSGHLLSPCRAPSRSV